MVETLVNFFLGIFSSITNTELGKLIAVFVISLMPILELRGGLIAAALLDLSPIKSFLICYLGNVIPIPFILWFITPIFNRLKKTKRLSKLVNKLEKKADKKKGQIEKYQYLGLLLFVGIPLPGTGAWTGCLIAALLNMDKKKALIAAMLGVLLAGIIMLILSYGILSFL